MNAKIRTSLVVLLINILLLAVAAPAFARTTGTYCSVEWPGINKDGAVVLVSVPGHGEITYSGNIATVSCEGTIPLGEKYIVYTLYNLEEARGFLYDTYGAVIATPFIVDAEDLGFQLTHDFKGVTETSEYWEMIVHKNGDFTWEKIFDLSGD